MLLQDLSAIFERDLNKLYTEIEAYPSEEKLWIVDKAIPNSAGNLCLHLIGNLNHFIGTILGNTGYQRQRELEFSSKNVPRQGMLNEITHTKEMISGVLSSLSNEGLDKTFPVVVFDKEMTTGFFLVHLAVHLGYHLGQVNYHRRLLGVEG